MHLIETLIFILLVYLGLGIVYAILFLSMGVARVDTNAAQSGLAFKVTVAPGMMLLWPIMLGKWVRS